MFNNIRADIDRYAYYSNIRGFRVIKLILLREGIWALIQYRAHHWVHYRCRIPIIRQILLLFCIIWQKLIIMTTGIEIPAETCMGKGIYIGHPGGVVINDEAIIGENCDIANQVTIGRGGRGENAGVPIIGDRVHIGVGAKVIGKIRIGNDSAVGANAVVVKDVPDNAVVAGVPAKTINMKGSYDFITYRGRPE